MSTLKYRDSNNDYQGFYVKVTDTLPVGSVYLWGGITAPSGYLICDGRAVSRTEYADLFKAIGTNFGSGDGLTTFNIPDYRGRVPVGLDGADVDFDTIGKKLGSKELQEHSHDLTLVKSRAFPLNGGAGDEAGPSGFSGDNAGIMTNTSGIQSAGTGDSGNIQPSLVTNFIIKASNKVALERGNVVDSLTGEDTDSAPSVRAVKEALVENYSTNEVKTNKVWIDGKPIYRKTINFGALPNTTTKSVAHGISNLDEVILLNAIAKSGTSYKTIPDVISTSDAQYMGQQVKISISSGNVVIYTETDQSSYSTYVTIEYTKTTD